MAIQQHPLPQDISSYRFRLIGDMTIKQFASLAISIILGIIVYGLPLPFFFKYPLTFIFIALGIGMAFVPVQGRTLDVWIIAFIKSIYSPTLFSWKKTPAEEITADTIAPSESNSHIAAPSVSNAAIEITKGNIASTPPVATPSIVEKTTQEIENSELFTKASEPPFSNIPPTTNITPISIITKTPEASVTIQNTVNPTISITPRSEPAFIPPKTTPTPQSAVSHLPIPFTPTTPNTLVGLTISNDNHIIDGVLVEIKKNGLTLRATKSNKLGQFMFARPLENGIFQILAEKEGHTFITYSLELTGEIIRPLKIQAQS